MFQKQTRELFLSIFCHSSFSCSLSLSHSSSCLLYLTVIYSFHFLPVQISFFYITPCAAISPPFSSLTCLSLSLFNKALVMEKTFTGDTACSSCQSAEKVQRWLTGRGENAYQLWRTTHLRPSLRQTTKADEKDKRQSPLSLAHTHSHHTIKKSMSKYYHMATTSTLMFIYTM